MARIRRHRPVLSVTGALFAETDPIAEAVTESTTEKAMSAIRSDLLHRTSGGLEVTLLWNRRTATLVLELADHHRETWAQFEVPPDRARYAFDHPYPFVMEQRRAA
jgi:hypothetical protein